MGVPSRTPVRFSTDEIAPAQPRSPRTMKAYRKNEGKEGEAKYRCMKKEEEKVAREVISLLRANGG